MSKIISIHSFRGGTGRTNLTANLATLMAMQGLRVGVVDADIQSPGIHSIFGLDAMDIEKTLNDYLWRVRGDTEREYCEITEAAYDVTDRLNAEIPGKIFLTPSSLKAGEIARVLREGYDVGLLDSGFQDLIIDLELDALLIDTHPGFDEETLLSIVISDMVVLVLRPDTQDYMGTSILVDVARKLDVQGLMLAVNKAPGILNPEDIKTQVEQNYACEVAAVIPHSEEMMVLGSSSLFILMFPDDPVTAALQELANRLMN